MEHGGEEYVVLRALLHLALALQPLPPPSPLPKQHTLLPLARCSVAVEARARGAAGWGLMSAMEVRPGLEQVLYIFFVLCSVLLLC